MRPHNNDDYMVKYWPIIRAMQQAGKFKNRSVGRDRHFQASARFHRTTGATR